MQENLNKKIERGPLDQFKQHLDDILYKKISVDNINQFAETALSELIDLNESVVDRYVAEYSESVKYTGAELEDKAYKAYGLDDLNIILARIGEVRDTIASLSVSVINEINEIDNVITPPDSSRPVSIGDGNGTYEKPKQLDRLLTLAYILERDFDMSQDDVRYTKGITTDAMMRQEPYVRVEIEDLERVVYVCNEEGNASYVFDTEILDHLGIFLPEMDVMSKNQRNALIRVSPSAGKRIIQSPEWRDIMSGALRESLDEPLEIEKLEEQVPHSEFSEKSKFLEYGDFEKAVRTAFDEAGSLGNIKEWYRVERKQHEGWPAAPEQKYKDSGWAGFSELVGKD
jgi:hypothetical protein